MQRKIGAVVVVVIGAVVLSGSLWQAGIKAQEPKSSQAEPVKTMPSDVKVTAQMRAGQPVYGTVSSAWPTSGGNFHIVVLDPSGRANGFIFRTGDLQADSMVKTVLMALETQSQVGAYEDPITGELGGLCVFARDASAKRSTK